MRSSQSVRSSFGIAGWVALGGGVGSAARWALAEVLGGLTGLLVVNIVGCILIGVLYGWLDVLDNQPEWIKPLLGTGFLGGFTTFSSAILLTSELATTQQWVPLIAMLIGLPLACVLGVWFGNRLVRMVRDRFRVST